MKSDERAMKLMAYADGELEGADLAEVEGWIRQDAEAVLFANDLAELGDLVKTGHRASKDAKATASFDLADAIMNKVAASAPPVALEKPKPKVTSISEARARKRSSAAWVAAGLALAASVFLVTRGKEEAPMARATSPVVQPAQPAPTVATVMKANSPATPGVDVENPGKSVSVFYLPDSKMTTSVVVWVDESGAK